MSTDQSLVHYISKWLEDGYEVLVTGDHGINDDNGHCGTLPCEREVPLWIIGDEHRKVGDEILQLEIMGIMYEIIGVK